MNLNVGDLVECVNVQGLGHVFDMVVGEIYSVAQVEAAPSGKWTYVNHPKMGVIGCFKPERFIPASGHKLALHQLQQAAEGVDDASI